MSKKVHPPRLTKTVRGGLRPQGGRRDAWWTKRWMTWLESLHMGARLGRGRNYAQLGQIKTLDVAPGRLSAEVQGADAEPYHVAFQMPVWDAKAVTELLMAHPIYTAQLYAHHLPMSLSELLAQRGYALFPVGKQQLNFFCTCKDWARPCKHLAAALCLFADAMAADPLLLFRFRGVILPEVTPTHLPQVLPEEEILRLHPTPNVTTVPRRLGTLPYWHGAEDFRKTLEFAYRRAHERALTSLDTLGADFRFPEDAPPEVHTSAFL